MVLVFQDAESLDAMGYLMVVWMYLDGSISRHGALQGLVHDRLVRDWKKCSRVLLIPFIFFYTSGMFSSRIASLNQLSKQKGFQTFYPATTSCPANSGQVSRTISKSSIPQSNAA